jgi:D-arabinose 1-dehydrogenase-like Zn-dependent alcohol dehydrogenase
MSRTGTIFPLVVDSGFLKIPLPAIIMNGLRIQGSCVASRSTYRRMLDFTAHHGIKPMISEFPMTVEGIEEAFAALDSGKLRYRAVLVAQN